jgi:hypothetical protein
MGWLAVAYALAIAQATPSGVKGTVTDRDTGVPVAGALVSLPDLDRAVVTDAGGRYRLPSVASGPQHVTVRRIGYEPRTFHALVPRQGDVEIHIALRRRPTLLQLVEVHPALDVRGVTTAHHDDASDRSATVEAMRNHPLLSEPDALLVLTGGGVTALPESPSGLHVRGGASDQTAFLLDGIPVLSPYHTAGTFSAWNPDALARVSLSTSALGPDGLSGAVSAETRAPGVRLRVASHASNTQASATLDGPLGVAGAGFLVSARTGFPGYPRPSTEASYLDGQTGDLVAKVEAGALGGRVRIVGYDAGSEFGAAARAAADDATAPGPRHAFEWGTRSLGAVWTRPSGRGALRVQAWRSTSDAQAHWATDGNPVLDLAARRSDLGVSGVFARGDSTANTAAGFWMRRSRTQYLVTSAGSVPPLLVHASRTPVVQVFIEHARQLREKLSAGARVAVAGGAGSVHFAPEAQLRWSPVAPFTVTMRTARTHQFAQSLRNPESMVSAIFPADLFAGSTPGGVPVARGDLGIVTADYRTAGTRVTAQGWARALDGLVLVAPRTGEPFATTGFATGSATVRGFSVDASRSGARYALVGGYSWQRVRYRYGDSSYTPDHGPRHTAEGGVLAFPSPTLSIRLGALLAVGRRATGLSGGVEWEACNLLDRGCEFGGAPRSDPDRPGAIGLPAYFRLDLGVRKHWHLHVAGRDAQVALFGAVTNVTGRGNVLTLARTPPDGDPLAIAMRPFAPLVLGMDWRFP